jgi:hypothetical protein
LQPLDRVAAQLDGHVGRILRRPLALAALLQAAPEDTPRYG